MTDDTDLAEAAHESGIRRLHSAYADAVNRRAWSELDRLFVRDAPVVIDRRVGDPVRLAGGAAVGEFVSSAVASFEFFEFVVLNAHIVFPPGEPIGDASGRVFMCEIRQSHESGRMTTAFGLYHDRYRLELGRWRFAERRYHSLARSGHDLDVFAVPVDPGIDIPGG